MDTVTTLGSMREQLDAEAKVNVDAIDTDALRGRHARSFFFNDGTPAARAVLAQMAPGATCPRCGQSGPHLPGREPCPECGRNTVHE